MATKNLTPIEQAGEALNRAAGVPATDDPAPETVAAPAETAEPVEPVQVETPAAPEKPLSTRDSLAKRFSELRTKQMNGEPTPARSDEPGEGEPVVTAAPAPKPVDDPIHKIKVDGREIELPLSEIVTRAQRNVAEDARLRELDRREAEIAARQEALSRGVPAADTGARPHPGTPPAPAPLDEARLRDIADRLASGTVEEQAAALKEYAELIQPAPPEPEDVDGKINHALMLRDEREAVNRAVNGFATAYPDIAKDPDLELMTFHRSVGEMISDLGKAGIREDQIAALRARPVLDIAKVHRAFHNAVNPDGSRQYPTVRDYDAVLKTAGDYVMGKFGKPVAPVIPAPDLSARTELKRGITPQPRTGQTRAEAPAPEAGARKSAKDIVRSMAKARGQYIVQ